MIFQGNDIILVHRSRQSFQPNRPQAVSFMMYEVRLIFIEGGFTISLFFSDNRMKYD
jgi:hypothetical protein